MTRLILQVAAAIFGGAFLTLMSVRFVLDSPADQVSLQLLQGHTQLLAETIGSTPPAERRKKAGALSEVLGYGLQIEPETGVKTPTVQWRAGAIFIVAPVSDTHGQIALGPIPFGRISELSAGILLAAVLALILAIIATLGVMRRIRAHEDLANRMCGGDFSARAARDQGDALDGIGSALNQLADRISQLLTDERDLLRTVAHEVRAPIARMHFRVEKIQSDAPEKFRKDAVGLNADLQQVDELLEELLTYVAFDEFDHERPELQMTNIPVMEAVDRLVEEVTAVDDEINVSLQGNQETAVFANPKLFDRAVTNLLLNAMAYGRPNIVVDVRAFDEEVVVDVQDSGPGIPEHDRPKVIKPFVRLSEQKTRGTGLGLAIVTRIMRLHGGRLHILDAPDGGASIQLVWPNSAAKRPSGPLQYLWPFGASE